MERRRIDELVERARRPKGDALRAALTEPVEPLALTGEADRSAWFPKLLDEIEDDVSTNGHLHEDALSNARSWARWVLGPNSDRDSLERLARGRTVARLLNRRTWTRISDCAAAPIEGEGLELLRSRGDGAVVAFMHTGIWMATVALLREMDRPVFVPALAKPREPVPRPTPPRLAFWLAFEDLGVRFVDAERGFGVMRRLLKEGEVCWLPADVVGNGNGILLGRQVRTHRGPMALSMLARVPLVLAGSFWDETGFRVRVSEPFEPQRYKTVRAMHAAVLALMDEWLSGRPEQLLTPFPTAELADLFTRFGELAPRVARAREIESEAEGMALAAKDALNRLKKDSPADDGISQARTEARSAAVAYKHAKHERKLLTLDMRKVKHQMRGPEDLSFTLDGG